MAERGVSCKVCGKDNWRKRKDRGGSFRCRPCANARMRTWVKKNPEKRRAHNRKYNFGLTAEEFAGMLDRQSNACAICRRPFVSTPHVDHCHKTNVIRGLLCGTCNRGIGMFEETAKWLTNAAFYVKRNGL